MTVTVSDIIPAKFAENVQTQQYLSPAGQITIIDKFTATNTTGGALTISVNIVPPVTAAGTSNLIVSNRSLAANETYIFPELVGHVLRASAFISTIASAAGSIVIRASGRVVT